MSGDLTSFRKVRGMNGEAKGIWAGGKGVDACVESADV